MIVSKNILLAAMLIPELVLSQNFFIPGEDSSDMTSFYTSGRLTNDFRIVKYKNGVKVIGVRALLRHRGGLNYPGVHIGLGIPWQIEP